MRKIIIFLMAIILSGCLTSGPQKGSLTIFSDGSIAAQYECVQIEYDPKLGKFFAIVDPNCEAK